METSVTCSMVICDQCERSVPVEYVRITPGKVLCWRCMFRQIVRDKLVKVLRLK